MKRLCSFASSRGAPDIGGPSMPRDSDAQYWHQRDVAARICALEDRERCFYQRRILKCHEQQHHVTPN
jgi:hypothetical protein